MNVSYIKSDVIINISPHSVTASSVTGKASNEDAHIKQECKN